MAVSSSATLWNTPRRMASSVIRLKKRSTRLIQEAEVGVEAGVALEPGLDLGVLVGGVVVDDQVQIERFGRVAIDGAQEAQELPMTMPRHAFADDLASGDVERCEQGRRSVSLVVVGHRAGAALLQRQSRLRAIERLD